MVGTEMMLVISLIRLVFYAIALILLISLAIWSLLDVIRQRRIEKERYEKTPIQRLRP